MNFGKIIRNLFSGNSKKQTTKFPGIVVAEIKSLRAHPNADKLRLVMVDTGSQELEIVCGAPNLTVGDKAPLALVGAKMPDGSELKEATIRGVKSTGMLCATDELGLGGNHEGILILPTNARVGDNIDKYL